MTESNRTLYLVVAIIICLLGILAARKISKSRQASADPPPAAQRIPAVAPVPPASDTVGPSPFAAAQDWDAIDDPATDGWDSEAFAREAQEQLDALGDMMKHPGTLTIETLQAVTLPDFSIAQPDASALSTVFRDPLIHVQRAMLTPSPTFRGIRAFLNGLTRLKASFANPDAARVNFKVVRVVPAADQVTTRQRFSISGRTREGMTETHATWEISWQRHAGGPLMRTLSIDDVETVTSTHAKGPLFSDCTESVLATNDAWQTHLLVSHAQWLRKTEEEVNLAYLGTPGIAIGDVNGDGLADLYLCQGRGLPNRLFIQNRDGTATDRSGFCAVDWLENSRAALFIDLDNDGDQDLVVAVVGAIIFAANDGTGVFSVKKVARGGMDATSLAAADVDGDGDLDVYQCVYHHSDVFSGVDEIIASASANFVYHDANNAGRNQLLRNDGDWTFTDITEMASLDMFNRRFSYAALFTDYDDDGDPDLYVANDFGRDSLYRNETQDGAPVKFIYISESAGADPGASGMGLTGGDVDRDGDLDVYIANMFSAAGGRIAYQQQFRADATPEIRARIQRFARGNTLLQNQGDGTFEDISEAATVTIGRWAWGTLFSDINNDGWEDLVVANGFITNEDSGDL